jgi:AcrR family transcriptional regulator
MSPRRYRSDRRQAAAAETRRRIVEAAVVLHAEQGSMATSYAQLAQRADVAVPTVYKHFPDRAALMQSCTGHVFARSPALGPEMFQGLVTAEARLAALAKATYAVHRFQAPWMRWGVPEAAVMPELAKIMTGVLAKFHRLVVLALEPRFAAGPPASLIALIKILLDFAAWRRLTEEAGLSQSAAAERVTAALTALLRAEEKPARHRGKPGAIRTETRTA